MALGSLAKSNLAAVAKHQNHQKIKARGSTSFERANIEDRRGKFSQEYENIARKFTEAYTNICLSKPSLDYSLLPTYEERSYADDSARLFFIRTKDFSAFSEPERIYPKGSDAIDEGRMIDPFVLDAGGEYHLFFKQNGVSVSRSLDLEHWEFLGHTDGGENAF